MDKRFSDLHTQIYLENIIERIPYFIFWKNTDSVYLGCNQTFANLIGKKSPKEIIGKTDYDLGWGKGEPELFRQGDLETMRGKSKINVEEILKRPDGTLIVMLVSKVPLYDQENNCIGVLGISADITDRKKVEEELRIAKEKAEAANQAKTEFIANMNHDLRTPLAGMIGMAETIMEEAQEDHIKAYAQDMVSAGKRLLDFANSILEMAQLDIQASSNQLEIVDLKQTLQELKELFAPTLFSQNLHFELSIDPKIPPRLSTNAHMVHRILLNLIGNAIKFTDKGGISVHLQYLCTEEDKMWIALSVKDTGIGIPPDMQVVIFEPFKKLTASYKGVHKGNGLGLYIVKQFVEKLGGDIQVESIVGKGSAFTVTLPFGYKEDILSSSSHVAQIKIDAEAEREHVAAPKQIKSNQDQDALPKPATGQPRVLVVEDDEISGTVILRRLKRLGCQTDLAVTGQDAIDKFKQHQYDLIYMDIGLPDKDGREVTQEIRRWEKEQKKPPVPIIALTAHVNKSETQKYLAAGLTLILEKPVSPKAIQQHIDTYINHNDEEHEHTIALLDIMRKDLKDKLPAMQEAYNAGNWDTLKQLVHKINGSASYCADEYLKSAAADLEKALTAEKKQEGAIKACFERFLFETRSLFMHILLIDDALVVRLGQTRALETAGFKVDCAESGEAGLIKMQNKPYDAVLVDLNMPEGLSGIETVKAIREWEKQEIDTRRITIFAMTTDENESIKASCLAAGINAVFYKPLSRQDMTKIKEGYCEL